MAAELLIAAPIKDIAPFWSIRGNCALSLRVGPSALSQINLTTESNGSRPFLEDPMELILIAVVLVLLFGGSGFWGYHRW